MKVRLLNAKQVEQIRGQEYAPNSLFSPTEDADGNMFISQEEVDQNTNPKFEWVKDLLEIEHKRKEHKLFK